MYSIISIEDYHLIAKTRDENLAEMIAITSEIPCIIFFNNFG